jgi:hypothetical protein
MSGTMSARRRNLYVQAQDISDAPQWAADLAGIPRLPVQEPPTCARQ